jgi:hypothetical protein
MRVSPRSVAVAAVVKQRLEQRFQHAFCGQFHDLVLEAADPQRSPFFTARLRNIRPTLRLRSVTHPLQAGGQISQICLQVLLVHRLADAVDSQGLFAFQSPKAIPQVVDVRDVVIQRSEHQGRIRPCSNSYPCRVCAHRNFTPCIVPVFLPSRASECGNLHSAVISRFNAKPVPVPLRSRRLRAFFHVGPSYSGEIRPRASPHARIAPLSLFGSMLSETPGAREPLSSSAVSRMACALGQHDRQSPKLSRSRGYVSDSWHTPFTSPNSRCQCSGSGRLDRPYPERLLGCS